MSFKGAPQFCENWFFYLIILGLYRLCGSANKKRILREAFERNARGVELNPDSVPDINVITGLLKDYLRELPQPLFSKCLYQMTVDALGMYLIPKCYNISITTE